MKKVLFVLAVCFFSVYLGGCLRDNVSISADGTVGRYNESVLFPASSAGDRTEPCLDAVSPAESLADIGTKVPQNPAEPSDERSRVVPILMFHDLKTVAGGTWSMADYNFRKAMEFILSEGYTPVTFSQLAAFVDGSGDLPEKPVCITFDDGYYSNYELLLPIVTELKIPVTVFMTCKTVRDASVIPGTDPNRLYKLSIDELAALEASPYVDVQSHTYGLHGENTTYGEKARDNSMPLDSEDEYAYKVVFGEDCFNAEYVLHSAGVRSDTVFSYPCGKYNYWAEEVLRERGYRASVTVDSGKINLIKEGDRDSLFLLGRLNVNDSTSEKALRSYLEQR